MTTADGQPGEQHTSSGQREAPAGPPAGVARDQTVQTVPDAGPIDSLAGPPVTLPEGVVLAQGERVLSSVEFPRSAAAFWVKSRFVLTDRRLIGRSPGLVLGLIPTGSEVVNTPLASISTVETTRKTSWGQFVLGVILAILGLALFVVGALIGVVVCLSAFNAGFAVTTNAGQRREYPISSFARSEALAFANRVNTAIAERHA